MDMAPFDLLGPLPTPRSTTVLEASAGTGKTFALAGLVTRYVAEGVATLDQMLLITFGRAASQELRERVRSQILDALLAFDDPASAGDNQLVTLSQVANVRDATQDIQYYTRMGGAPARGAGRGAAAQGHVFGARRARAAPSRR